MGGCRETVSGIFVRKARHLSLWLSGGSYIPLVEPDTHASHHDQDLSIYRLLVAVGFSLSLSAFLLCRVRPHSLKQVQRGNTETVETAA